MGVKSDPVNWRDWTERLFWTAVTAALTNIAGASLFSIDVWKAAALTGGAALINGVLGLARYRLSILPTPGEARFVDGQVQGIRAAKAVRAVQP